MKKVLAVLFIFTLALSKVNAQEEPNPITTAAPFLLIAPDARAGGMGDVGVATSADAFSLHHNPSKLAFSDSQFKVIYPLAKKSYQ